MALLDTLEIILSLIRRKGITGSRFLADLGLNRNLLSDWKRGKSKSYRKHIAEIAAYFGVTADYLLQGGGAGAEAGGETGESGEAAEDVPEDFILLARKAGKVPKEYRRKIYKLLESTIDIYLEAMDRDREKRQ